MLSYSAPHKTWVQACYPQTLEEAIHDELGLAYERFMRLNDAGIDPYDDTRARLDAYLTGLENLLDWSE